MSTVGDTPNAMLSAQRLDGHTAVIEDTKPCGSVASRMVEAGDRDEGAPRFAADQVGDGLQHRPDNAGRSLVDAGEGWGVAFVEIATAGQRCLYHAIDIRSRVKALDLGSCCHHWLSNAAVSLQSELLESLDKRCIAQWSKWMIGAKAIVA